MYVQNFVTWNTWYENSVRLIPSSESSLLLTLSLAIILPSLKYLPVLERNSSTLTFSYH